MNEPQYTPRSSASRARKNRGFKIACWSTAIVSVLVLCVLFLAIGIQGAGHLNWNFITSVPSRTAGKAGMGPAMWGSVWICVICAVFALPLGVGTAVFLEEYKPRNRVLAKLHGFIQLNIANLAGVPSIVYGIIGLTVFVQMFGVLGNANAPSKTIGISWYDEYYDEAGHYLRAPVASQDAPDTELRDGMLMQDDEGGTIAVRLVDPETWQAPDDVPPGTLLADAYPERVDVKSWYYIQLPFGRGVLAGGFTLMLVILPIVIISSQEAIKAVPSTLREGALGLGATKWQAVRRMTLPSAIPGIMTGSILAMSRAIGEAAPILILAGIVYITFKPQHLMDDFTAMPLQIYDWAGRPQDEFHAVAAAGIIVLLVILLSFNAVAVFIRQKFQRPLQ